MLNTTLGKKTDIFNYENKKNYILKLKKTNVSKLVLQCIAMVLGLKC